MPSCSARWQQGPNGATWQTRLLFHPRDGQLGLVHGQGQLEVNEALRCGWFREGLRKACSLYLCGPHNVPEPDPGHRLGNPMVLDEFLCAVVHSQHAQGCIICNPFPQRPVLLPWGRSGACPRGQPRPRLGHRAERFLVADHPSASLPPP